MTHVRPYAEVERIGRWSYWVSVRYGLIQTHGSGAFTRRGAMRKAARVLARYNRDQARRTDVTRVESPCADR